MHEPSAILAISSTDRYIDYTNKSIIGRRPDPNNPSGPPLPIYQTNNNQPTSNVLRAQYENNTKGPYANDFQITAPNALINGYIDKIIISQIQLQYYLPTIIPGANDYIIVDVQNTPSSTSFTSYAITLPFGFFTPYELASMLQIQLNTEVFGNPDDAYFSVNYSQGNVGVAGYIGFLVTLDNDGREFAFPDPDNAKTITLSPGDQTRVLKAYKTFGFTANNKISFIQQSSWYAPNFLYTPYIDIYSEALTNYQSLKDTDSSTTRRKGLLARIYLSGVGNPQSITEYVNTKIELATFSKNTTTGDEYDGSITGSILTSRGNALGSEPFVLTYDMNSPKVINWSPDTAINSLDFQLRDCYGDLLFTKAPTNIPGTVGEVFNTEFQMTLLCIEG